MEKNLIRVFHEGTAFFVTFVNPYDLMAQRGKEILFLCTLRDTIETERDLRSFVERSDFCDFYYLNVQFDTPAEEGVAA